MVPSKSLSKAVLISQKAKKCVSVCVSECVSMSAVCISCVFLFVSAVHVCVCLLCIYVCVHI